MPIWNGLGNHDPRNRSAVDSFSSHGSDPDVVDDNNLLALPDKILMSHATAVVTTFQSAHRTMCQRSPYEVYMYVLVGGVHRADNLLFLGLLHRIQVGLQSGAADAALVASTRILSALVV